MEEKDKATKQKAVGVGNQIFLKNIMYRENLRHIPSQSFFFFLRFISLATRNSLSPPSPSYVLHQYYTFLSLAFSLSFTPLFTCNHNPSFLFLSHYTSSYFLFLFPTSPSGIIFPNFALSPAFSSPSFTSFPFVIFSSYHFPFQTVYSLFTFFSHFSLFSLHRSLPVY